MKKIKTETYLDRKINESMKGAKKEINSINRNNER